MSYMLESSRRQDNKENDRMKILITGDMHITDNRPVNRVDDYGETVLHKTGFIFRTADKEEVSAIVSPGDFTDTPSLSYSEFSDIVDLFKNYSDIPFLCTFGQHDMQYRTKVNTALSAFNSALDNFHILQAGAFRVIDHVGFYGCSYDEDPVDPAEVIKSEVHTNVLLIHRMLLNKKIWSTQTEFENARSFLRQHKYDLIVSGDNHQSFENHTTDNRWLFNCGAMMRNKIDMIDHKPYVVLFDTDTRLHKKIYIPIEPAEKVFDMRKVTIEKERDENLDAFVSGLSEHKEMSLSIEDNLNHYIKNNKVDKSVVDIIMRSLRGE